MTRNLAYIAAAFLFAVSPVFGQQTAPQDVQTARGIMRDKPFALSYPADLSQGSDGRSDVLLSDAAQDLEVTLTISPATPSLSAEFDARAFDGPGFIKILSGSVPGARLIGNSLLKLPGGAAHAVHWAAPASGAAPAFRYIDLTFYDSGRGYRLSFAVRESALERWRKTIGFILAHFSTTSTPQPCCANPAFFP